MFRKSETSAHKKPRVNKYMAGFAALATTAVVGAAGFAGAAPVGKPTKAQCQAAGYSNYGQCVKQWAQNKPDSGYGGNASVTNNNNVSMSFDMRGAVRNTVNAAVNIFN